MPPPAAPEVPLEFNEQQDRVVLGLSDNIKTSALVTLALGGLTVLAGLILWFWWWESFFGGLFLILIGVATKFLGLVLLSTATDTRFIAETKGCDKIHLLNALTSINLWLKVQITLGAILSLVLVIRLLT